MGFGFAILRLSPQAFWTMTPREIAAAMRRLAPGREAPLGRGRLAELMRRFPDDPTGPTERF